MYFPVELLLLAVLILISAFLSAAETALTSISRHKIKELVDHNISGARPLQHLRENPARMLSAILIANNIVNIWASVYAASLAIRFFERLGWGSLSIIVGLVTGLMTLLILVFGEITPKTIALRRAQFVALLVARPILVLEWILQPVAAFVTFLCRPLIYVLGGKVPEKGPILTEEEIKTILSMGENEGIIEETESEMIHSIFEFGETTVREVMTPKPDMHCINVTDGIEAVVQLIRSEGHSRIPIYEGNVDNIIGLVFAKDILGFGKGQDLREYLRPVLFIPESKKIDDLLHQMQSARTHLAVVVDEYGSTAGIVSLEDIVEEIVGEIHDEFEKAEKDYEKIGDATYVVSGGMTIGDINDLLGSSFPETVKEYDTIGGFVFEKLDKMPAVGDVVHFGDFTISVERILKRRITRVKISRNLPSGDATPYVGG
ncbi:MAG: hemolysin family protein [Candidatus Margulisiibacteriota bacterium]